MSCDLCAIQHDGICFLAVVQGDLCVLLHADRDAVSLSMEGLNLEIVQMEPWDKTEIPGVGDFGAVDVSVKDAVRARPVKELIGNVQAVVSGRVC